jgi:hypothetical protein
MGVAVGTEFGGDFAIIIRSILGLIWIIYEILFCVFFPEKLFDSSSSISRHLASALLRF